MLTLIVLVLVALAVAVTGLVIAILNMADESNDGTTDNHAEINKQLMARIDKLEATLGGLTEKVVNMEAIVHQKIAALDQKTGSLQALNTGILEHNILKSTSSNLDRKFYHAM